jgi:hypothetical protein
MTNGWLKREIADGLSALVALSLEGQPAAEVLPLTADIWLKALSHRLRVEELDAPRLRSAFQTVFGMVTRWPAPQMVLDHLPPRPELPKLPAPKLSPEQHAESVARVKEMMGKLVDSWGPKTTRHGGTDGSAM